jgi:hypothetical protein
MSETENNVARFFADRVHFLKNAPRVINLTRAGFLAFDFSDKVKERYDYTEILSVSFNPKKKTEFTIKASNESMTYVCDDRDRLLSFLYTWKDACYDVKGTAFKVERVGKEENSDHLLWVSGSHIERTDLNNSVVYSRKFLVDIDSILMPFDDKDVFWLACKGCTPRSHKYISPDRDKIVNAIKGHLQENFGLTLRVKEIDPVELDNTTAPVYLFETPSKKYYKNHEVSIAL